MPATPKDAPKTFIVCPDGTTYLQGPHTAADLGGWPFVAEDAESALLDAYRAGYANFPPMRHYDNSDVGAWSSARDARILAAARRVIDVDGMRSFSRAKVAQAANMAASTICNFGVSSYQKDKPTTGYRERILSALMAQAIADGDIGMIRVGVADGSLRGEDVPEGLRAVAGV